MRLGFIPIFALTCISLPLQGALTLKNGHLVSTDQVATLTAPEHFGIGMGALNAHDWNEAARQFQIVTNSFPNTSQANQAFYYLGVSYYRLQEFDFANDAFSQYLKCANNPQFFQETIEYKFDIAEKFKSGAKKHVLGTKNLPKWASGSGLALTIYDEVIAAVPSNEIAAKALVAKGDLLWTNKDYREAINSFQMVIKRFPKSELAPECYQLISKVYLEQSEYEFQNPDILAFAQINLRRFQQDFPREERIAQVEADVKEIEELYANGLFLTGQFYEKTNKRRASLIYYYNAIKLFPETHVAEKCRRRLMVIDPNYKRSVNQAGKPASEEICNTPVEFDPQTPSF